MEEGYATVRVQVPSLGSGESRDTEVVTVPSDSLIANVLYTPTRDMRGDWDRSRYMELLTGRYGDPNVGNKADASLQTDRAYLPANVEQSAILLWLTRLYIPAGGTLYWSSHGLEGRPSIPDPGGTVEVVLEPRTISTELCWREHVPSYWWGKTLAITYMEKPLSQVPPGGGGMFNWNHVGVLVDATERGMVLEVQTPHEFGMDSEQYEFPYDQIDRVRLL